MNIHKANARLEVTALSTEELAQAVGGQVDIQPCLVPSLTTSASAVSGDADVSGASIREPGQLPLYFGWAPTRVPEPTFKDLLREKIEYQQRNELVPIEEPVNCG